MSLSIPPFNVQLPSGYQLQPDSSSSGAAANPAPAAPVDVVNISGTFDAGHFTAVADDTYRLGSLFKATPPTGQAIAGYRVALGDGGGKLLLGDQDVSDRTSFTADEFAHLTYKAGPDGSQQSLVIAAQTGKRLADGTLSKVTDSQAMQITANVTGTRSINAMNALTTNDTGTDAGIVSVVKEAGILTGLGAGRPTLSTDGNFTAVADDTYRLGGLFKATPPAGQTIAGYRVSLGDGGGKLLLGEQDVSDRTSFTADEFAHLTYKAGADGSQQSLVVAAQTGKRLADGTLSKATDSQAMQIAVSVTGTRSINAMNALTTTDTGTDAAIVAVVKEAGILTGLGTGRPTLSTDGNFTAVADDTYRLGSLFKATPPTSQTIAGYRVALGDGGGKLLLGEQDVSDRTSFTADEFAHLTYKAGADGSQQSLVVAAQTGKRLADGTLSKVTDSQAMQITASVTGTRSINAMNALTTTDTGTDAGIVAVVKEAGILTGLGAGRPTLSTDGNFTAAADDTYRLGSLFKATAPTGQAIAGYRVALGDGGGTLLLGDQDVSDRTSFTADEFARLTYKAGADGSQQSLVVAAQTGKRLADGTLTKVTDSQAVQITASVTGTRSINAMNALTINDAGTDANIVAVVKEAGILTGLGAGRPTLSTDGNFTAAADDTYRLGSLFKATPPTGQAIAGYRVALGDGGGKLLLGEQDVSHRTSFTADEFAHLTYKAGPDGSQQSLVIAAQTGKRLADGTLSKVTDSQAMQITASVTGTRSINAMNALTINDAGTDANIVAVVKETGILSGLGAGRPTMQTIITPDFGTSLPTLATSAGAFTATGGLVPTSTIDPAAFNSATAGGSVTTGVFSDPTSPLLSALLLLGGQATGAFKVAGTSAGLSQAIAAYTVAKGL